jgi:type I restriction enzyme M protein
MPLTPDTRRKIDQIRDYLYGGGYPDPMSNAEQLAFLFFFYLSESIDADNQRRAKITKKSYEGIFSGDWALRNPLNAPKPGQKKIPKEHLRWSVWAKARNGEGLVRFVRDEVFPFYTEVASRSAVNFMDGARLAIDEPTVLTQIVNLVDELRLDQADADTKGDLFEHVLKQIKQAGELGQFRTPRHVIRAIVEMIDPQIGETVYDPAAGTAGFLVAAYDHIRLNNSSDAAIEEVELDGKKVKRGHGDKLSAAKWNILGSQTFFGNDVDNKMVHLATMSLTLRGLPNVRIARRNVLTTTLDAQQKSELGLPLDGYNVILANPPFSGRLDKDRVVEDVKVGTTTATEILFLKYMMDNLKPGGRCGVIVPEGVLFGSTGAHKELRRQLIENNSVQAVLSLPGGVFQPYSGVKTSVLLFEKPALSKVEGGGTTKHVLFLHADNDGYKLDAQHDTPIEQDDLPALIAAYKDRDACWKKWRAFRAVRSESFDTSAPVRPELVEGSQERARPAQDKPVEARTPTEWTEKWWFTTAEELRANDYNLSAGRYRPLSQAQVEHRDPRELLDELAAIEVEIAEEIEGLKVVLAEKF